MLYLYQVKQIDSLQNFPKKIKCKYFLFMTILFQIFNCTFMKTG